MDMSCPGLYPAFSIAVMIIFTASSLDERFGANPPSSPTDVFNPFDFKTAFRLWYVSAPILRASLKDLAPIGAIMNSCMSTLLSACLPPLRILKKGTGRRRRIFTTEISEIPAYPSSCAAAFATARETPKIALAPNFALFSVPSRSIMKIVYSFSVPSDLCRST